ncbi:MULTISPECIES: alpha/beta hydrolase [unclassified Methylophaga]|uniref:alpha/beta hydrolase n=1 Tax=unclassified Methylophaga TaxID=2629249 RepID=UPI0025F54F6D|nr:MULTISPECIES: alpha/beta fold hydrolase [unclassified Methylophaga]|tara:strand:+ start:62924 stop:63763 length:840 start_codon:yes stop_codon:yes gene_type:complete
MVNLKKYLSVLLLVLPNFAFSADREATVCGWFKERLVFTMWSSMAPTPDASRVAGNDLIQRTEFTTADNKILKGYKYQAQDENGLATEPEGYILVAMGNAMIADLMITTLERFSQRGYDIYIYDYRGYGESQGKRRINAIIEDYKELVAHLNTQYEKQLLYGISLGGAVMANVIGSGAQFDRAVIDSSPSRLSPHGCPERIDPVANIPDDAINMLLIMGEKDSVLGPEMTSEFRERAEQKGASVYIGSNYAHPFMDSSHEIHNERLNRVIIFLDGSESN